MEVIDLAGAVDMHIPTAPDVRPRSLTDLKAAQQARDAEMQAILIKSHVTCTRVHGPNDRPGTARQSAASRGATNVHRRSVDTGVQSSRGRAYGKEESWPTAGTMSMDKEW